MHPCSTHTHTSSVAVARFIIIFFFFEIQTKAVHFTYIRFNRVRLNNADETKKRLASVKENSRRKKNVELILKYIEWMTIWLSVRLQSKTCLIFEFANFSTKYYNSSVNKHRKQNRHLSIIHVGIFAMLQVDHFFVLFLSKLSIYRIFIKKRSEFRLQT